MSSASKVAHGRLACRACWAGSSENHQLLDGGRAQLQNDPGYWGAANPSVLVLGMTKGFTQSHPMSTNLRAFDSVAFDGFRPRLLQSLQAIGLMSDVSDINAKLRATEANYGFASIIRCSLTAIGQNGATSASSKVISALKNPEAQNVFDTCANTFFPYLRKRTRLVVLLGNDDKYVTYMNETMGRLFKDFRAPSFAKGLVYSAGDRFFVHTGHPSGSNGHFGAFISADSNNMQGRKCHIVRSAVQKIMPQQSG